jgi:hypothetical protein
MPTARHRAVDRIRRNERLGDKLRLVARELQAAIAACHARALDPADTDWAQIAALYQTLAPA